ncbi:MAG: hypothetical protein ACE5DL_02345 [Nitrosopumilaceae archaeon]
MSSITKVKSGDIISESGHYKYYKHVKPDEDNNCKVMASENDKFFRDKIHARHLAACAHEIWWIKKD